MSLVALFFWFALGEFSFKGSRGFIVGFLVGIVSVFVFFLVYSYLNIQKSVAVGYEEWKDEIVTCEFDEKGLTTKMKYGHSHLSWHAFKSLWQMPDAFILFHDQDNYLLLPVTALDEETKQLITHKVAECGGSITQ